MLAPERVGVCEAVKGGLEAGEGGEEAGRVEVAAGGNRGGGEGGGGAVRGQPGAWSRNVVANAAFSCCCCCYTNACTVQKNLFLTPPVSTGL